MSSVGLGGGHFGSVDPALVLLELAHLVVGLLNLGQAVEHGLIDETDRGRRRRGGRRRDRLRSAQRRNHFAGDVLPAEDDDALVYHDGEAFLRGDRRDRELRARKDRSHDLTLLVAELLLELNRYALPIGVVVRALKRGVVLLVELRLDAGELPVRRDERGKRTDRGLVEEADVGEVGGDRRGSENERKRRGDEDGLNDADLHGFLTSVD